MEIRQKILTRHLLIPALRQSLNILSLPLLDLKILVQNEILNNPFLEEIQNSPSTNANISLLPGYREEKKNQKKDEFKLEFLTKKPSLQDILLRQLGMFSNTEEEFRIGQEIISNIDENGYLKVSTEEMARTLGVPVKNVENVLRLIQQFEPPGVGARSISECLLIQLALTNENEPLLRKIIENHLDDVAKKNYSRIAKKLKVGPETIEPLIEKILKLNPKPGRNYSSEEIQRVIPDVVIEDNEDADGFQVYINNEEMPNLTVNNFYKDLLKQDNLEPKAKDFLKEKLYNALQLLRAISRRQNTLRKVMDVILEIQKEAISNDLSYLKPLTFKEVAQRIGVHETTVCRAVMNKYIKLPWGTVTLKELFPGHLYNRNGQPISDSHIKYHIKEIIETEDKRRPLSDEEISKILSEREKLNISRRTVTKYRKDLRILSSVFRRQR
ncbi:MAG: RNA polymerase factor sigma-54 [Candidatus Omnitrophica bacterium]|nr:RNA polymerase factor sigma-54 [Candidatus Omnitrophota bacterium]